MARSRRNGATVF